MRLSLPLFSACSKSGVLLFAASLLSLSACNKPATEVKVTDSTSRATPAPPATTPTATPTVPAQKVDTAKSTAATTGAGNEQLAGGTEDAPQRVKFGAGRTTSVIKGTVRAGNSRWYVLGASEGQNMTVHLTSPGKVAWFAVRQRPKGDMEQELIKLVDDWSGELPANGDYTIIVDTDKETTQNYTLEVSIR